MLYTKKVNTKVLQINKNQLPSMRENGSVENTEKYTIAEYEPRGLRLKDLAERISSQIDTHFILYDYKGNIYTDNEDVIQILKDEYPSGDYPAYSNPTKGFSYDNMSIEWYSILKLLESGNYEWTDYTYIPKWYYVYRKLAEQLNRIDTLFSDKSKGKQLYEKCFGNQEFRTNNEWIEKFDSEWKIKSLDPIHLFASLNNNKLGYARKIKRINLLFRILDDNFKDDYKDINFDGCPAPMTINIIGARDEDTQEEVWSIFYEIMHKSQDSTIDFSKIQEWYGVDIGAFTIFLFWIDAKNFLPLDKNTVSLLEEYNKLNTFPTKYQEYKKLLSLKNTNLYLLLAFVSYDNKKQELLSSEDKEKLFNYLGIENSEEKPSIEESNKFKLIFIKPLKDCNEKYLKTLNEEELYLFDKAYSIHDETIEIDKEKDLSLFDLDNINININAVVGKNGTGKSTIVELLFAIINNISFEKKISEDIIKIDNLRVELIFESLHIYKITINDDEIKIFQYTKENNKYINSTELNISEFDFDKLFYTIAVNYSQHSLNSLYMGDWIHSLFHKNDAYQTPIVIEPYRKKGDININRQEVLIKQRLVSNLLLQEDSDNKENSPRQLTEFYRAKSLNLSFNINKIFYLTDNVEQVVMKQIYKDDNLSIPFQVFENGYIDILSILYKKYNVTIMPNKNLRNDKFSTYTFEDKIHLYILKKLVSIAIKYKKYQVFFNIKEKTFKNIEEYIDKLFEDRSHICYKLKQAINFLRFESLVEKKEELQSLSIEDLSNNIENIILDHKEEKLTINELVPPSFFNLDIILDNGNEDKGINFNSLSSGEKQKIYSVNSILYHINNINSVDNSLIQYKRINVILDEIELYFHPELQRNYLSYLLHVISKANTNNILAVNILFVTHSPFILSDIPDSKILFLDKDSKDINSKTLPSTKEIKTFGANIHELLINGFFMNNSIGEFALKEIKTIVNFHHEVMSIKEEGLLKDKEKSYNDLKDRFYFVQEHIGEDYISGIVKNHLIDIEKRLNSNSFKTKRIEALKKELEDLQRDTHD